MDDLYGSGAGQDLYAGETGPGRVGSMLSRNAHMGEQIHAAESNMMDLVRRGALPASILDKARRIWNGFHRTEGAMLKVKENPIYAHYWQKWMMVPEEWVNLANEAIEYGHVDAPESTFRGHSFSEFLLDTRILLGNAKQALNEGMKAAGHEGVDPSPSSLHPRTTTGTGIRVPVVGRLLSSIGDAAYNLPNAVLNVASGFNPHAPGFRETMMGGISKAISRAAREFDGQWMLPPNWRYLDGHEAKKIQIKGRVESGPHKGWFLIGDEAAYQRFKAHEPERFTNAIEAGKFGNAAGTQDHPFIRKIEDFQRELPLIPGVHKASILDVIRQAHGDEMKGAALKTHGKDFDLKILELAKEIDQAAVPKELADQKKDLLRALWSADPKFGNIERTSLAYRAYQQAGRIAEKGSSHWLWGLLGRMDDAASSAAFDLALNANPIAAANQVMQTAAQAGLSRGATGLAKHGARVVTSAAKGVAAVIPAVGKAHPEWRLTSDPIHTTVGGLGGGFANSGVLAEQAVSAEMPGLLGKAVDLADDPRRGRILRRLYSDDEIRVLKAHTQDGVTDLSSPEVKDLSRRYAARWSDMTNGTDLLTSKPAFFAGAPKAISMFTQTPGTIAAASARLFTRGGLLDQGSAAKNLLMGRRYGYVLGGWGAAKLVASSPLAKFFALAASGAVNPALLELRKAVAGAKTDSEKRHLERLAMTVDAAVSGDPKRMALALGMGLAAGAQAQIPGLKVGDLMEDALMTAADEKMLQMGGGQRPLAKSALDLVGLMSPSLSILADETTKPVRIAMEAGSGPRIGDKTSLYTGGLVQQLIASNRLLGEYFPLSEQGKVVKFGGIKTGDDKILHVNPIEPTYIKTRN